MTQNGNENAKFQLWETFYGHICFQHHHLYQKTCVRKRSMQPVDILGGLILMAFFEFLAHGREVKGQEVPIGGQNLKMKIF